MRIECHRSDFGHPYSTEELKEIYDNILDYLMAGEAEYVLHSFRTQETTTYVMEMSSPQKHHLHLLLRDLERQITEREGQCE